MGYHTEFVGDVTVEPPLNDAEVAYLVKFNESRRMKRGKGPYFVEGEGYGLAIGTDEDVIEMNYPPDGQPGLWCQWRPSEDGARIGWDGAEKFYHAAEWMQYIIDHFLTPAAQEAQRQFNRDAEAAGNPFDGFTFDHKVSGVIKAQGEDADDKWRLIVEDNEVRVEQAQIVWPSDA